MTKMDSHVITPTSVVMRMERYAAENAEDYSFRFLTKLSMTNPSTAKLLELSRQHTNDLRCAAHEIIITLMDKKDLASLRLLSMQIEKAIEETIRTIEDSESISDSLPPQQ